MAFLTGFENNASCDRLWEARRTWRAIVNTSRSWGVMARDYVTDRCAATGTTEAEADAERRVLYHRHFAWLTALRHALREPRAREGIRLQDTARVHGRWFQVDETQQGVRAALLPYLDPVAHEALMGEPSKAAQILALQSAHLGACCGVV